MIIKNGRKANAFVYILIITLLLIVTNSCEKEETKSVALLSTSGVTEITQTTAISGGIVTDDGGSAVTVRGVCWSITETPTINDNKTVNGKGTGSFNCTITDLEPATTYYVRAYAINSIGACYSDVTTFTTLEAIDLPKLAVSEIAQVTQTSAIFGNEITCDGGAPIIVRGICWSTSESPTIEDLKTINGKGGIGSYKCKIKDLDPGTTYYVRAYATNSEGTNYCDAVSFTTLAAIDLSEVATSDVSKITQTTAVSGGDISDDGGAPVTARGICWSTNETPTIEGSKTVNGKGTGSFNCTMNDLTPNTTYYVRAYATNSEGTSYGNVVSFETQKVKGAATVTTSDASKIMPVSAISGGSVTDDGGAPVTARGVCWSTKDSPTIKDSKTMSGTGTGTFVSNMADLKPSTTYYVRAYATNSVGTSYGDVVSFKTLRVIGLAAVITTAADKITQTSAILGGNVSDDGGVSVTARGICWSKSETPTINDSKTMDGTGKGIFTSSIADLEPNTTYYARAYATNSVGTKYGNTISFKTLEAINLPNLVTADVMKATQNSAASGGTINDDGGSPVTARGICWSTNETPTIEGSKTVNGKGTGSFNCTMNDLTPNTTYYVRAYATNSEGTSYGNVVSFKTLKPIGIATLITTDATKVMPTTAVSGGSITDDGGAPVTARGICWSTKDSPTTNDSKTMSGTGTGSFASNMADLKPNTTYYVRAYAINSVGTSYGNVISFTTKQDDKNVVDGDGNVYEIVTIGNQTWLTENLKTTRYNDGTAIPLVSDNNSWESTTSPGYSWYLNDEKAHKNTYGALYNWHTVRTGKLCPVGWHVPSDAEWATLNAYLGGNTVAGGKLKEKELTHWKEPNIDAANQVGFTALPGGHRHADGMYSNLTKSGHWWSSTEFSNKNAGIWDVFYLAGNLTNYNDSKQWGCSVRCVRN